MYYFSFTPLAQLQLSSPVLFWCPLVYNIAIKFHENIHGNVAPGDLVTAKLLRSIPVVKGTIGEFYHMEGVRRKN